MLRGSSSVPPPLLLAFSLVLLVLPQSSGAPLPTDEPPQLGLALLHLRALLDQPPAPDLQTDPRPDRDPDPDQDPDQEEELTSVEPFAGWDPSDLDSAQDSYQDSQWDSVQDSDSTQDLVLTRSVRGDAQRDLEDRGRLSEALTAVAGGLQAVSREKGGFGFRFGRKRWTRPGLDQDQG